MSNLKDVIKNQKERPTHTERVADRQAGRQRQGGILSERNRCSKPRQKNYVLAKVQSCYTGSVSQVYVPAWQQVKRLRPWTYTYRSMLKAMQILAAKQWRFNFTPHQHTVQKAEADDSKLSPLTRDQATDSFVNHYHSEELFAINR